MGLWVQRLTHSAGYSPGPWDATAGGDGGAVLITAGPDQAPIADVRPCRGSPFLMAIRERVMGGPSWYEQVATAKLIADAPEMLQLLAVMLDALTAYARATPVLPEEVYIWVQEAETLMRRHVPIGVPAVDRANGTHRVRVELPAPTPPTLFDESAGWE